MKKASRGGWEFETQNKSRPEKTLTKLGFLSCVFLFCFTVTCTLFIGESHHQC